MQFLNIFTKKTYEKNGEKKVNWMICGTLKILDDGKKFIELNMFPGITFYCFEPRKKEQQTDFTTTEESW